MAATNRVQRVQVGDYLAALQESLRSRCEPVPPGWERLDDIAKRHGKTHDAMRAIVQRLRHDGLAESKMFRVLMKNGEPRQIAHYRLVKK